MMPLACPWSRRTALHLLDQGIEVHVIDFAKEDHGGWLDPGSPFFAASVRDFVDKVAGVHLLKSRFTSKWRYLTLAPQLSKLLSKCKPDVLLPLYGGGYALISYLSRFRPYAVYVVGSDVLALSTVKRELAKMSLGAARALFVNGSYLSKKTHELVPDAQIIPLLLGIDTNTFQPGSPPPSPLRIVCTRAFLPIYNNGYLIEALAHLPSDIPEFKVTFVSPGPLLESTKEMASRLLPPATRNRVEFLGGVTTERLVEELKRSHIYVSLSRSDGTAGSLLEALACGLYPVVSDIPQNREWINGDDANGALVPLDQPEEFSGLLAGAIKRGPIDESTRQFNRRQVVERADCRNNIGLLARHLETLRRNN